MTDTTPPLTASEIEELNRDLVTDIMALSNYSNDPMWANHAEVSKAWLKRWLAKLNEMPHLLAMLERLQMENKAVKQAHEATAETLHGMTVVMADQDTELASLRRQLAEREAEVERLRTDNAQAWKMANKYREQGA